MLLVHTTCQVCRRVLLVVFYNIRNKPAHNLCMLKKTDEKASAPKSGALFRAVQVSEKIQTRFENWFVNASRTQHAQLEDFSFDESVSSLVIDLSSPFSTCCAGNIVLSTTSSILYTKNVNLVGLQRRANAFSQQAESDSSRQPLASQTTNRFSNIKGMKGWLTSKLHYCYSKLPTKNPEADRGSQMQWSVNDTFHDLNFATVIRNDYMIL